jgi:hypothetical protein
MILYLPSAFSEPLADINNHVFAAGINIDNLKSLIESTLDNFGFKYKKCNEAYLKQRLEKTRSQRKREKLIKSYSGAEKYRLADSSLIIVFKPTNYKTKSELERDLSSTKFESRVKEKVERKKMKMMYMLIEKLMKLKSREIKLKQELRIIKLRKSRLKKRASSRFSEWLMKRLDEKEIKLENHLDRLEKMKKKINKQKDRLEMDINANEDSDLETPENKGEKKRQKGVGFGLNESKKYYKITISGINEQTINNAKLLENELYKGAEKLDHFMHTIFDEN